MKMKFGKRTAALLAAALLAGAAGGCGRGEAQDGGASGGGEGAPEDGRGRYVEREEILPEELADWDVKQIFRAEDKIHLLAVREEEGVTRLREWERGEEGFADVTQGWLASMELECGGWLEAQLMQDGSGAQYLFAGYVENEAFKGHLWRSDGETAAEITPEQWSVPNDWGGYEMITGMAALDNGNLIAVSYTAVTLLAGESGAVVESEPMSNFYEGNIATDGENVYFAYSDENGVQIEKRENGRGSDAELISFSGNPSHEAGTFVFDQGTSGAVSIGARKDGTLIAASESGIFLRAGGTENAEWEMLLEGVETDFALADYGCMGLIPLEDGSIYALMSGEEGVKLNRYEYDPDAVTEVREVLKLYTVQESSLLRQAAVLYHREHPDIRIDIQSAYPMYYYDPIDYEAVYQALNTMLMGDDAPDLLVMDHLNLDSYVSKGLLENLDSVVKPMEESGELLSNITEAYAGEDGGRYAVPLQFTFPMGIGRDMTLEDMSSMEALADFLAGQEENYLGSRTAAELVNEFYPYFCGEIVRDKQLDREAMGRNLEYLKAIADNCEMVDAREPNEAGPSMWDLGSEAKFAIQEVRGFRDCMMSMGMVDYIKGDFTAFENQFIPSVQIGICTKSRHGDTAEDFLRFALSESVQNRDYNRGFPVNRRSLEKQAAQDRSGFMVATMITAGDGSYEEFNSKDYPRETADRIVAMCEALEKPVKEDAKIQEVLSETVGAYLDGTQSLEETLQKIEGGLKMYLAE